MVSFDCSCGSTFFLRGHLWVVTTDASNSPENVVIVSLTTKRQNSDTTVTLTSGNHGFIKHDTVVNYADARIVSKKSIIQRVHDRDFEPSDPFTIDLVKKIQQGLLNSPYTPKEVKKFYSSKTEPPPQKSN